MLTVLTDHSFPALPIVAHAWGLGLEQQCPFPIARSGWYTDSKCNNTVPAGRGCLGHLWNPMHADWNRDRDRRLRNLLARYELVQCDIFPTELCCSFR